VVAANAEMATPAQVLDDSHSSERRQACVFDRHLHAAPWGLTPNINMQVTIILSVLKADTAQ